MDRETQNRLFEDLGAIKADLASIKLDNQAQLEERRQDKKITDERIRSLEKKNAGMAATVSVIVGLGFEAIKKSLTGGS